MSACTPQGAGTEPCELQSCEGGLHCAYDEALALQEQVTSPATPCLGPHRYVIASQAHGGAFWGRCRVCGQARLCPQVPETLRWAYQVRGTLASQKARADG